MSDWADQFLGCAYRLGAQGPDEYDCWGLVRAAVRARHGIEIPAARTAQVPGWRLRADTERDADGDVIEMRGPMGRHVGMLVREGWYRTVLHAHGGVDASGQPWGEVAKVPLARLAELGYWMPRIWTLQPFNGAQA